MPVWTSTRHVRPIALLAIVALITVTIERRLHAFNYVVDANGTYWGIQDDYSPRVDTGSIRATQAGPGQSGAFSTSINGFGGIKVLVETSPAPYLNGELMRGFGLAFDGTSRFTSTQSLDMGGVVVSRSVYVQTAANWGRWLDTFTNTTKRPLTIRVAFGGQSGIGTTGGNSSAIVTTSSGDALVTPADAWVEYATPLSGTTLVGAPQVTVIGSPAPFAGAMTFAGNWLGETFSEPLSYSGHDRNFQGYVNTLTLQPGQSRSLLHFVVIGKRVNTASSAAERASVEATASLLAATPEVGDLTPAEICSIANFDLATLTIPGFSYASCGGGKKLIAVAQPPVPKAKKGKTAIKYDVVEKTVGQLQADMEAGIVTSESITRAYLDRIEFYDQGQLGFHAYEIVAPDAIAQAKAADKARRQGARGPLLGIPVAIKNNYDTFDMATTNGSFTFANFRPARDAFQVAKLRAAGAVILGKAALEEYATSGHYSNDAWGQVWSVFKPSQSTLASSGGSGSAVAASLAAAAMGSQTGDSLYAPASAQSVVTLRGTDGLESGSGIQPLTWMTDFGGVMARSVSDLADMLNVVAGTDPDDPATAMADAMIPDDWRTTLDVNALKGKRIGYVDSAWADVFGSTSPPFGSNPTIDAMRASLKYFEQAGATIVQMGQLVGTPDAPPGPAAPSFPGGSIRAEGWRQYIDSHPELIEQGFQIFSEVDVDCSQKKVEYVRNAPETCLNTPQRRLTADEIQQQRDYRQIVRPAGVKAWMDAAGVDAVVYPGLLSDVSLNDGGGGRAAFGRRDTPSAQNGVPTLAFPAGRNDRGQPVNIQLMGRAWDDPRLVGFAYAFEYYATLGGDGHQVQTTAPALPHDNSGK